MSTDTMLTIQDFQEGLKKAKDSPDPPLNPMDMD